MKVVVHQHKRMQIHPMLLTIPNQKPQQGLPVTVVFEDQLTVVAAQYHVVRVTGQ